MAESNTEYSTIIGADANFKGELTFDSGAKVLGRFEGSITSKGRVHVADGARCQAQVKAKEVAVEGHIEGNVEASDRVELRPKGTITGDVTAARMTMADGASIDGHCRIGANSQAAGAAGQAPGGAQSRQQAQTEVKPGQQQQREAQQQQAQAKSR